MKKHKITGERLKALRKARGLTQVNMANLLNIKEVSYRRYEMGDYLPKLEHLIFIADFFEVSTDYLLNRTNNQISINKLETNDFIRTIYEESKHLNEADKKIILTTIKSLIESLKKY